MRARSALSVLVLSVMGCGRSCGCIEGERTYESLRGAVRVELVRDVRWTGGRLPGPITNFFVRVHATPRIHEPVQCDHVELSQNPTGSIVAFRCQGTRPWTLVRRLRDGTWFRECDAPVGTGDSPDYARVEPLSSSAERIATCFGARPPDRVWPSLLRAIASEEGEPRAAQVLVALARETWPPTDRYVPYPEDPWPGALESLPEPRRGALLRAVCEALTREPVSAPLWARAAPRCPLDAPAVAEASVRALAHGFSHRPERDEGLAAEGLRWAAAVASTRSPAAAGAAACASAGGPAGDLYDHSGSGWVLGAVLAITGTRCPVFERRVGQPLCGPSVECDGGLCQASALSAELSSWRRAVEAPPGSPARSFLGTFEPPRVALALAYAQGELPREVSLPNARYHYTLPEESLPYCNATLALGTPCTCPLLRTYLCDVPPSADRATVGPCSFAFDDARRRVVDVRAWCQPVGGSCLAGRVCCPGTTCRLGPDARCVAAGDAAR